MNPPVVPLKQTAPTRAAEPVVPPKVDDVHPTGPGAGSRPTVAPPPSAAKPTGWIVAVIILAIALPLAAGYGFIENKKSKDSATNIESLEADLAKTDDQKSSMQGDLEKAQAELADVAGQARSIREELEEKSRLLAEAVAERDGLQASAAELESKNQEIERMTSEIARLTSEMDQLNTRLADAPSPSPAMDQEIARLREENARLKSDLDRQASAGSAALRDLIGTPAPAPSRQLVSSSTSNSDQLSQPAATRPRSSMPAWVRLGEYKTGPNKGKWYYVAADGYSSPLYRSQAEAIRAAETRAGHPHLGSLSSSRGPSK